MLNKDRCERASPAFVQVRPSPQGALRCCSAPSQYRSEAPADLGDSGPWWALSTAAEWLPPLTGGGEEATERRAVRGRAGRRNRRALVVVVLAWAAAITAAAVLSPSEPVRRVALGVHLVALAVGFGPVLVVEVHGLLWLAGRRGLAEVLRLAHGCDPLIWGGLLGLVASGTLLDPDLTSPLVRLKLALVLAVGLNGVNARRIERESGRLPAEVGSRHVTRRYLVRVLGSALVSQIAWWGTIAIGLTNL